MLFKNGIRVDRRKVEVKKITTVWKLTCIIWSSCMQIRLIIKVNDDGGNNNTTLYSIHLFMQQVLSKAISPCGIFLIRRFWMSVLLNLTNKIWSCCDSIILASNEESIYTQVFYGQNDLNKSSAYYPLRCHPSISLRTAIFV